MRKGFLVIAAALAAALSVTAWTGDATAMPFASAAGLAPSAASDALAQEVHYSCRCERAWPHREYWQWGWHHPPWQTPWNEPDYFWSLDPPRIPADIWARKWHLPRFHHCRWRRRQCRAWR